MAKKTLSEEEIKNIERKKQIAILKAKNELLDSAIPAIEEHYSDDDTERSKLINLIEKAKEENNSIAKSQFGISTADLEKVEYNNVTKKGIKEYEEHLKKRGITDDSVLYRKDVTEEEDNVKLEYGEIKKDEREDDFHLEHIDVPVFEDEIEATNDNDFVNIDEQLNNTSKNKDTEEIIREISSKVSYDILPLPSNGECYVHKKDRLPVGYLTASDENIIMSANLYRDGKVLDILLANKIFDNSINPNDLIPGDRDAILLWLRATGYGIDFPIKVRDPQTGTVFESSIALNQLKTKEFKLKGDKNGWFDYKTEGGDEIKFKYLTKREETDFTTKNFGSLSVYKKAKINDAYEVLLRELEDDSSLNDKNKEKVNKAVSLIKEWMDNINVSTSELKEYTNEVTERMIAYTMSVNGNTDKKYIREYIENMRANESRKYRVFVNENTPGIDFTIKVNRPESLGGGSFTTFLEIDSLLFLSVA